MSWSKRESVQNAVTLGDEQGQRRKVGGLLVACPVNRTYPDKFDYVLVQQDGEELVLFGSASLSRQLTSDDVGKFVKCEFSGWGKSANGRFKIIDVNVWDGAPNEAMRAWPRYAEFASGKRPAAPTAQHQTAADKKNDQTADDGFAGFDETTDDDQHSPLPF